MKLKQVSLFLLAVLSPMIVFGLGVRIPDQDPLATARGNAFVATADNPSAIYYNPAGITQLEGANLNSGVYGIALGSHYSNPNTGASADTKTDLQAAPHSFFTTAIKNTPLTLGIGVFSPFGFSLDWPDNTTFNTLATKGEIIYITLSPVLAWKVTPTFSIAAGPSLNYGRADIRRGIVPSALSTSTEFRFHGDDIAPGFSAGILWQPITQLSFGATYRSESKMRFRGTASTSGAAGFGVPDASENSGVDFPFPQTAVGGISYRPTPKWNVEFDVDWTDWSRLQTLVVSPTPTPGGSTQDPLNWKSSCLFEWGVTRYFDHGWRASGGYIYSQNSVPDKDFNPSVPDSDRHIFSIGVGRTYKKFSWDASYQLSWGPTRTVSGSATTPPFNQSADGKYEFLANAISLSIGYHF